MFTFMNTLSRFSPLSVGRLIAKNRIVVPAMASQTADHLGFATEATYDHYESLTQSCAGIIIVEYTAISPSGRSEEFQLLADSDDKIEGLSKIAKKIKDSQALSVLQLTHALAKSTKTLTGGTLYGASAIPVPVKDREMETPQALSLAEIDKIKSDFLKAVRRAAEAGFDGVELHSAHGYGLNQMLSPLTNKRCDQYGGSFENRARMLFEIVSAIKISFPQLILSVRIPGQDYIPGGLELFEMTLLAQKLEELGVDIVNVSSGLGGWRRMGDRKNEGYLVEDAAEIQSLINAPTIGVGGIESAEFIDRSLNEKKFSLAAVGRAILKDPQLFAMRVLSENKYAL